MFWTLSPAFPAGLLSFWDDNADEQECEKMKTLKFQYSGSLFSNV